MRSCLWLAFTRLNVQSCWMPRKVAVIVFALFALWGNGRLAMHQMSSFMPIEFTYVDYVFWMFGSLFNPQPGYFPLIEAIKILFPYMLLSYFSALYMHAEGVQKALMTLPRVRSFKGWYGSHVLTLFTGVLGYVLIMHGTLAVSTVGMPFESHADVPQGAAAAIFPYVGERPLFSLLAFVGVQIVVLSFFQFLQWVVTLATSSAVTGFYTTLIAYMVVLFAHFPDGLLKWIPGVQLIVKHNAITPAFTEGIPVFWTYGYVIMLQLVMLGVGWRVVRHDQVRNVV